MFGHGEVSSTFSPPFKLPSALLNTPPANSDVGPFGIGIVHNKVPTVVSGQPFI